MRSHLLFYIVFSVVLHRALGTVNFALHKSAVQSSTLYYNNFNWTADKAVDGNSNGNDPDNSATCSATFMTATWVNHTWEVDIGFQIIVKTIAVYRRTDKDFDQLNGVQLYIGNVSRPWIYNQQIPISSSNMTTYVFKPNDIIASVISLMRLENILVICEVTVEGECLDGNFSEFCNLTCGKCFADQPCNKENGTCLLGCNQGWKGTLCKEGCKRGNYGYNCNETCGHCLYGNSNCSTSDGNCTNGCIAGWQGYHCNRGCVTGKYGFNCNETCGNCLYGNNSCSTSNGHCNNGCKAGWQGDDCKKGCDTGQYGYNCKETCGNCLYGNTRCDTSYGHCNNGCKAGWQGDDCKTECRRGTYGYRCNETCGNCYNGNISCSLTNGSCMEGCEAGWHADICTLKCEAGTYGFNCYETCGHCLKGNDNCSKTDGQCKDGCKVGWTGDTCKSGTLGTVTTADVGSNAGVIVGSVLAAVGVSIFAMLIIIVIVKNRRKKHNNEATTDNVTPAAHYANLVVGNSDAACKITARSITEKDTTFSAIEEPSVKRGMPIGATNSHSGVMEPDVPVQNVYEKLRDVTETTESAYCTIDHNLINDQKMESMETCNTFVETLQSLESAMKNVEEEICVLLDKKEKLLSKELETARADKLRDKRQKKDSDKDKDSTIVKFVQALQSIEGELRILEDKRKCLLGRKEILLRQELAKTNENEK